MLTDTDGKVRTLVAVPEVESNSRSVPAESRSMYAITFDLDTAELEKAYPGNSSNYAWKAIGNFLKKRGFGWKQGSVYFGDADDDRINPVWVVLTIQDLAQTYPWFNSKVVRDVRMLRIEENNDLNPAIQYVVDHKPVPNLFDQTGT